MAKRTPSTIGESLYWSYANLAMRESAITDPRKVSDKMPFMIRAKLYFGLCNGTMQVRGFFDDEKLKLNLPNVCWYCGGTDKLSVDHIIPQIKGGSHGGENLIHSCRSCNSSKGSTDLLVWMNKRGQFPPLYLLRRYLKMVIEYCKENDLMDVPLPVDDNLLSTLPFDLASIPHKYPPVSELCKFVKPLDTLT